MESVTYCASQMARLLNCGASDKAADPPTGSMGSSGSSFELVQAMAGFGGGSGAADGLNSGLVNAETSQQPLLTTPQHA